LKPPIALEMAPVNTSFGAGGRVPANAIEVEPTSRNAIAMPTGAANRGRVREMPLCMCLLTPETDPDVELIWTNGSSRRKFRLTVMPVGHAPQPRSGHQFGKGADATWRTSIGRPVTGYRPTMRRLRAHPVLVTLLAFALAAGAVVAIAAAYGMSAFARAWSHLHPGWLALAVGAQLFAVLAYVVAYRVLARFDGGPRLPVPVVLRIVVAGFGPSAPGGGFALDKHALHALSQQERAATERVLGLGALEWALLAPAAWASAVVLLALGDQRAMPSLLWPWAIVVPIGFGLGLWLAQPDRRNRIDSGAKWRTALARGLSGVGVLGSLTRGFVRCWQAWLGTGLYWAFDIAALYACARFIGLRLNLGEVVVAYATGYAVTRRSLPLGGAGITEALMTFALHWVGQPVVPALAAVVVYRTLNFVLPAAPALLVRRDVYPLVRTVTEDRLPGMAKRRRAAVPR
jgi:uncharacterized membrane protein YbhN (UPF0104 family)